MASSRWLKFTLLGTFLITALSWAISGAFPGTLSTSAEEGVTENAWSAVPVSDDYVGSETCMACHDDQGKKFAGTKHAKLSQVASWKGKVQGCESCHGPGKAHIEDATDLTKIISFKNKNSKQISETCLSCHSGKESHNNFRRGEHWRNNVGCTDCHTAHGSDPANFKLGSSTHIADASVQNPGQAQAMLKSSEQQLCISCHKETKAQFLKPFHHKVLEGTMKCSDCHNPHGGFETKQTKLAVGADAACIKCHGNKMGPFVFEHGPLKLEGCATCHSPHGASNAKLLKRSQVRQLCIECHTGITDELTPGVPSRHNQAQMREQQCTVCHSAIHGSNSSRLFFR